MEFDKGMAGVALVVLSLIASAILGVVLNVDKTTVQRDTPIYQSDITGLFNASTQKSFIDYDVSANYNGYSWNDPLSFPVEFKEANTANNYPFNIYINEPTINNTTLRILGDDELHETFFSVLAFYRDTNNTVSTQDNSYHIYMGLTTGQGNDYNIASYYMDMDELYDIMYEQAIENDMEDALTSISFKSSGTVGLANYSYSAPPPMTLSNSISSYVTDMGVFVLPKSYFSAMDRASISNMYYPYSYLTRVGNNGEITYTFTYTKTATEFSFDIDIEGSNGLSESVVNRDPSQYMVIFAPTTLYYTMRYYSTDFFNPIVFDRDQYTLAKDKISTVYEYDRHREYLDPRYGVSTYVNESTPVTWKNGYENGSFDIIINASEYITNPIDDNYGEVVINTGQYYYNQWDFYYGIDNVTKNLINYGFSLRILQYPNGPLHITILTITGNTEQVINQVNIGTGWVGASIHIDCNNGKISVTPIAPSEWTTFLSWNSRQNSIDIGSIPKGSIYGFNVSNDSTYDSFRFQITNTSVFLNTYGVIMIDPEVNIRNWYPNNTRFMIGFTKTASTGNAITIGGVTYEIVDQEITVPQEDKEVKIDISEYNVTYILNDNVWEITIESPKSNTSATVTSNDTTISMDGAWYFNSAYYTIEKRDYQEYTWKFGSLAYGFDTLLVFMMIFLGLLTILTWKFLPDLLGFLDIGIIIVAEIILFIII